MVEAVRKKFHLDKKASQGSCSHANTQALSEASSNPRFCSHANTRAPFSSFRLPRFVRMRTRNRLSRASSSPRSCSHANTRTPFLSFRLPEVLFACEHASTFLELPATRGFVRMRTREHLSGASGSPRSCSHANTQALSEVSSNPRFCSHANTRAPFSSFQQPEVLFACEHGNAFFWAQRNQMT